MIMPGLISQVDTCRSFTGQLQNRFHGWRFAFERENKQLTHADAMGNYAMMSCIVMIAIAVTMIGVNIWLSRWESAARKRKRQSGRSGSTDLLLSGRGEECMFTQCKEGLQCDMGKTWTCKQPDGHSCRFTATCLEGSYCSGICTKADFNKVKENCPCISPLVCGKDQTSFDRYICLKSDGQTCKVDDECFGGACIKEKCDSRKPNASGCTLSSECVSQNCSLGQCQPPGKITHQENSNCNIGLPNDPSKCKVGLSCFPISNGGSLGVCEASPLRFNDPCYKYGPLCAGPYECLSQSTLAVCSVQDSPGTTDVPCTCRLPFPDPRSGNESKRCFGSLEWSDKSSKCTSVAGSACVYNNDCNEGTCSGTGVVQSVDARLTPHDMVVEAFAPINLLPLKLRFYYQGSKQVFVILSEDSMLQYSRSAGPGKSGEWDRVKVGIEHWAQDFDCSKSGEVWVLSDSSHTYGNNYNTCILMAPSPDAELKVVFHTSNKYDKLTFNDDSRDCYLLNTAGANVLRVSTRNFNQATRVRMDLPQNITGLSDLFAVTVKGKVKLFGVTQDKVIACRLDGSSFSYPMGQFGNKWDVTVTRCDVSSAGSKGSEKVTVVALCEARLEKRPPSTVLIVYADGTTRVVPGPGGLDVSKQITKFDCYPTIDGYSVRVLHTKSCVSILGGGHGT